MHHCESTVSAGPERKAHYRWRESSSGRKVFIVEAFLEVVLPEQEGNDRKHAEDEERDNVWGNRQRSVKGENVNSIQEVDHPWGATPPSLRTKMMRVRPAVTRKAPI